MPVSIMEQGEFAGWSFYVGDRYEQLVGPFFYRKNNEGGHDCAFRLEQRHMNGSESVHGGCLMSFADFCIFIFAHDYTHDQPSVTMTLNSEFISGAVEGELVEGRGEVVKAGGSIIFVRGQLYSGERVLLNYSATIKRIRKKES